MSLEIATKLLKGKRKSGGEGGIRTPGTLIRSTHDFQSCTFNRSVTSPLCNFKHLPCPIRSLIGQCVQKVSMRTSSGCFNETYHAQRQIAKMKTSREMRVLVALVTRSRVLHRKKSFSLWRSHGDKSPRCLQRGNVLP